MIPLRAELTTEPGTAEGRRAVRRALRLEVEAISSTDAASTLIRNLSEQGLLIETTSDLAIGETIQVHLPQAGPCDARIVWAAGSLFGCEFLQPVSKAAVSAALLLAPTDRPEADARIELPAPVIGAEQGQWPRYDFDRKAENTAVDIALMVSLALALVMVALFIYALLTFQFAI